MLARSRSAVSAGVTAGVVVLLIIVAASLAYAGNVSNTITTVTQTVTQSTTGAADVVNLDVIADWGGSGYDAFVVPTTIGAAPPTSATNSTGPGPNNANLTVSAGVPVKFVISNLDTAVLRNFSGTATTQLSIYNDTDAGQVALQYQTGQSIQNLPISHTLTINSLGLSIPLPPDTIVTFTYTFAKAGVYTYVCLTPCGPGMQAKGYMIGYVIVH